MKILWNAFAIHTENPSKHARVNKTRIINFLEVPHFFPSMRILLSGIFGKLFSVENKVSQTVSDNLDML